MFFSTTSKWWIPEDHKKYIGVDNSLILENLKKLSDEGAGLYIRLPIIQQVNATDEHIESVIHFLKENNIHARQVNLLPYHDIGKGKYASLDMEYHDDEMSVPVSELMEHFKSMFEEQGFNKVNIGGWFKWQRNWYFIRNQHTRRSVKGQRPRMYRKN